MPPQEVVPAPQVRADGIWTHMVYQDRPADIEIAAGGVIITRRNFTEEEVSDAATGEIQMRWGCDERRQTPLEYEMSRRPTKAEASDISELAAARALTDAYELSLALFEE